MIRINKIAVLSLGLGAALSFVTSAFACPSLPMGWYLGANAGASRVSQTFGGGTSNSNAGFGYGGVVGYKFMPYLGLEAGYIKYADVKVKNTTDGNQFAKATHHSYDVALVGMFPVSDSGFELFAKLGVGRMYSHIIITNGNEWGMVSPPMSNVPGSKNSTGAFYGLGASYAFLPYLEANLQWQRLNGSKSVGTGNFYSAGLLYIFS